MKKILYVILLIAELLFDFILMSLVWTNVSATVSIVTAVVCAALIIWQGIMLAMATDAVAKRKFMRNIALIMLIPVVVFIIMFVYMIVALSQVI